MPYDIKSQPQHKFELDDIDDSVFIYGGLNPNIWCNIVWWVTANDIIDSFKINALGETKDVPGGQTVSISKRIKTVETRATLFDFLDDQLSGSYTIRINVECEGPEEPEDPIHHQRGISSSVPPTEQAQMAKPDQMKKSMC